MAGPSEMVPLDDVSVVGPEHADVRPLLLEPDVEEGGLIRPGGGTPATGDGVDDGSGRRVGELVPPPPPTPPEL